jgi:hypothetical protein
MQREVPTVAVYLNPDNAIVLRKQRTWDEDGDTFIVIARCNAPVVAQAILEAAGFETATTLGEPLPKDPTAAERQRRRRAKV